MTAVTTTLLALTLIASAEAPGPQALLQAKAAEVKTLMGRKADDGRKKQLRDLFAQVVDYEELSRRALKGDWDGRTAEERAEFTGLLRGLIEKNYLENIERRPDFDVKWTGEKLLSGGARAKVLSVASRGPGKTLEIAYLMVARPGEGSGWVIVEVIIDKEVRAVRTYRDEFREVIAKEGWPALIAKMKDKLAE